MYKPNFYSVTSLFPKSLEKSDITDFLWRLKRSGLLLMGLAFPAALPLSIHHTRQPFTFSRIDVLKRLQELRTEMDHLISVAEAEKRLETEEYLSTKDFAYLVGLTPKTISNHASSGRFSKTYRENGFWYIHKSELAHYE
ncbi:MAG: helix-turn-helix domain-containing protein [Balneolaceae bacterium]